MNRYLAQKKEVFDISKFTVVGSPTITSGGVASGFSSENYVTLPISLSNANSWKIILKNNSLYNDGYLFGGNLLNSIAYVKGAFWISSNGTSWDVASGVGTRTNIPANSLMQLEFTGTKYIAKYSVDNGSSWVVTGELASNVKITSNLNTLFIGKIIGGAPANCSIDLPSFSITVDGQTVFTGTKPTIYLERRKDGFDLSKFTVVGTPTITEAGVVSGFSRGNYISTEYTYPETNDIKIKISFTYIANASRLQVLLGVKKDFSGFSVTVSKDNTITARLATSKSLVGWTNELALKTQLEAQSDYTVELIYKEKSYTVNLYKDKVLIETKSITLDENYYLNSTAALIGNSVQWGYAYHFDGSIDLPSFSITVDGKEVFTGAKENYYVLRS